MFFILSCTSFGQSQLGLKVNAGAGKIESYPRPTAGYTSTIQLSEGVGFFYNFHFGKRSSLGIEALVTRIDGKQHFEGTQTDSHGNVIITMRSDRIRRLFYYGFPVYYGLQFNKLNINIGVQISRIVKSVFTESGTTEFSNGQPTTTWINKSANANDEGKTDPGVRIGVLYSLSNRFELEGLVYVGTDKTYGPSTATFMSDIYQATIGIRFSLYTKLKSGCLSRTDPSLLQK